MMVNLEQQIESVARAGEAATASPVQLPHNQRLAALTRVANESNNVSVHSVPNTPAGVRAMLLLGVRMVVDYGMDTTNRNGTNPFDISPYCCECT